MNLNKYKFIAVTGILVVCTTFVAYNSVINSKITVRLQKLELQAESLNSFVKVDKQHKENIQKAMNVLNRYNNAMSEEQKIAIATEISLASMKYNNLDVDLICATITHESAFSWDSKIVSPAGALGLMQVMPETGKFLAKMEGIAWTTAEDVLFDPVINIRLGTKYLSNLIELYDVDGGLAAYNGGGKIVEMWLAQNRANGILYKETQNYIPAVLSLYDEFRN